MISGSSHAAQAPSADLWEDGCEGDPVRNQLVIPALIETIERWRPASIVDLGSGTGFVARMVDAGLTYRPSWTLIDRDVTRIRVAEDKCSAPMHVKHIASDLVLAADNIAEDRFEAALLCFTLLEFRDELLLLNVLHRFLSVGGIVIVVLPDPWQEINRDSNTVSDELLRNRLSRKKRDKFTGLEYPFHISRNELFISHMNKLGFLLGSIDRYTATSALYIMTFHWQGMLPRG